ncbi:DUF222 domain-containing protein [Microbacterium sp. NPDC055903]
MATKHLDNLHEAVSRLDGVWADAEGAADLERAGLIAANETLGALRRLIDGLHAEVAAAIAHDSRAELGADSLAKQQGYRSPAQLIAATSGGSAGEASRLISVGTATAPRADLLGAPLPPKHPAVHSALARGELSTTSAGLIIALLDPVRFAVDAEALADAETVLVGKAARLSLDDVRTLVARAEADLNPDGVAPREEDARARRSVTMFERDGSLHLNGIVDIGSGAAINGYVSAAFAARKNLIDADAGDADRRTVAQLQADALSALCAHALGCDRRTPAIAGASVVVRIALGDLISGEGTATVDGFAQPISAGAARRMAASGGVIPCVLGTDSEVLDWGREKRFFTRAQRLALVERDGGCAMCALPPEMTRAHHIDWWQRDAGPTDLDNGVLLCESCHHRIHDNAWEIRVDGTGIAAHVWFIPPRSVDPDRTPRLGGLARYSLAA